MEVRNNGLHDCIVRKKYNGMEDSGEPSSNALRFHISRIITTIVNDSL